MDTSTIKDVSKDTNTEIAIINKENIKDKIYEIRGQQVMLDSDLAEIYGYTTKALNQQVKNNIDHGYDLDPVAYKKMAGYYGTRKKFLSMMKEGEDYERARLFWFIPYIYGWTKYDSILLRTASQDQNHQHP